MNWREFSKQIDKDGLSFYSQREWSEDDPINQPILMATPALFLTGAPIALWHTAEVMAQDYHTVFILCEEAGDLGESFLNSGCHVLIYAGWRHDKEWLVRLASLFPTLILNTLDFILDIPQLAGFFRNVYWWLHESEFLFAHALRRLAVSAQIFKEEPIRKLPANVRVLCVSEQVRANAEKYLGVRNAETLLCCVPDAGGGLRSRIDAYGSPVRFLQVGTLDSNKGQDLLIEAISLLPDPIFERCRFTFVGDRESAEPEILRQVAAWAEQFFNIRLLPAMSNEELYTLYDESDVVVVPSRQESLSIVAVEAMMKEKICICTDHTGLRDYATDGESLLFFSTGDVYALAEKIIYTAENRAELSPMREAGRRLYERYFTETAHRARLHEIFG